MSKNSINPVLNFDILQLVAQKQTEQIQNLIDHYKEIINAKTFDSTTQNLIILQFYATKNINLFSTRLEKSPLSLEELFKSIEDSEGKEQNNGNLYILYNYIFFRKLNRRHASFAEEELINLRFLRLKPNCIPSLPRLKLFFSKMNFLFNQNMKLRFLEHTEEVLRIQSIETAVRNKRPPEHFFEKSIFVSIFYGSNVYRLPLVDQNNFCPIELRIFGLLLLGISNLILKNTNDFVRIIGELKENLEDLKRVGTTDQEHIYKNNEQITEVQPTVKLTFESKIHAKLCCHLRACVAFLELLSDLGKETDFFTELNRFVSAEFLAFGKFISKYRISLQNILAVAIFKNNCPITTAFICRKIIVNARLVVYATKKSESTSLQELSRSNNQILQISNYFNMALSYNKLDLHDQSTVILNSLGNNFKYNFQYWYRLAVGYYKIFVREFEKFSNERKTEKKAKNEINLSSVFVISSEGVFPKYLENILNENKETVGLETSKSIKNSNLSQSIYAFEKSRLVIDKCWDEEKVPSQKPKGKQKDSSVPLKQFIWQSKNSYLLSILEFLAYLYILIGKPLQSLKAVTQALQVKGLSKEKQVRLLQYKLKALQMLGKPKLVAENLKEIELVQFKNEMGVGFFSPILSRDTRQVSSMANIVNANVLTGSIYIKSEVNLQMRLDQLTKSLQSVQIKGKGEGVFRNHLVYYYSRVSFSRKGILKVLQSKQEPV